MMRSIELDVEADYVDAYCPHMRGQIEYVLPDRTRVDCLTDTHAIEFDWCRKWAEAVGQALYYARSTGRMPAIVLICEPDESRFPERALVAAPEIEVIVIPK